MALLVLGLARADGEQALGLDALGDEGVDDLLGQGLAELAVLGLAARADALGLDPITTDGGADTEHDESAPFDMERVLDALREVYDPEIPINIVDLGLVYRCEEHPGPLGTRRIEIDMSMTAPGCGMGDVLRGDAARTVLAVPGVDDVEVNLVWDPPWTIHRMSEAARLELGLL